MPREININLPLNYVPRVYQLPFLEAMDKGQKRAVIVWHRRAGKDKTCLNLIIKKMYERVGMYYYFFPTYNQGKKVLWDGIDKEGKKFLEHFPPQLIAQKNETELKIKMQNGSLFQIIGTDNIDAIVGTNPIGCIFSEYALQNPKAWDYVRPILAENSGWAVFIFTPRGMNHGWKILQQARKSEWFNQILTVENTRAISEEALREEREQMPQDLFEQEYFCKFIEGAGAVFRGIEKRLWEGDLQNERGRKYRMGVDLGKYQDFTVLTLIDLETFQVGTPIRFNLMDWNIQRLKIEAVARQYNNAEIVIDSTGLGDPIFDELNAIKGLNIKPVKFTELIRNQLLWNLQMKIEQGLLTLPNDEILMNELRSFQYRLPEMNELHIRPKLQMGVPVGLHDDCVFSLALAIWELNKPEGLTKTPLQNMLSVQGLTPNIRMKDFKI